MSQVMAPAAVVRALIEGRAGGDLEASLRFIAADSLDQGHQVTHDDWRRKWESMNTGCPDMHVTIEHSVESGEWVANRYTIRGTHTGDFFGQQPTGKQFEIKGIDMIRVRDGQIVEHWAVAEPL
jgi:predicted ester cyclase